MFPFYFLGLVLSIPIFATVVHRKRDIEDKINNTFLKRQARQKLYEDKQKLATES